MNWTRKDLIAIQDLQPEEIVHILDTALTFEEVGHRDVKKVYWAPPPVNESGPI